MRLPLAVSLESRDGGTTKDAKVLNGIVESRGQDVPAILRKRPGLQDLRSIGAGTSQALTYWSGQVVSVIGDVLGYGLAVNYTRTTTWNSSDKDSDITLSNGNLTMSITGPNTGSVRSVLGVSTGIWYFETTFTNGSTAGAVGLANLSAGITDTNPGQDTNSVAYYRNGGVVKNGAQVASGSAVPSGTIVGVLWNADARTIAFYVGGVLQCTVSGSAVPSGTLYAITGAQNGSTVNNTTNFGATAFTYGPTGSVSSLSPTTAGLQFSMQDNGGNSPTSQLMLKNATQAWTLTAAGTLTQITDTDYPGTYSVTLTGLTRSGTTATATTAVDTNFQVGSAVVIAGAGQSDYNGTQTITSVTPSSSGSTDPVALTITRSGTTATAVTVDSPHGFTNGQTVTISGADQVEYNGDKVITYISATSFSFTVTVTNPDITSPATGSPAIVPYVFCDVRNFTGSFNSTAPIGSDYTTFRATVATGAHGFQVGDSVIVGFETKTVTAATATTFDFTRAGITIGNSYSAPCYQASPAAISSITGANGVATVTTSAAHKLTDQYVVAITGASPADYNTTAHIKVTSSTTFTYAVPTYSATSPATPATGSITASVNTKTGASFTFTVANSPTTPATGTITATGGRNTVTGIAYLDGRFYVMDVNGVIYESDEDNPGSWQPLEFAIAQAETGAGKAMARTLNYLIAFKEWSTELFWDAGLEPPGATIRPVDDGLILVGCASGDSVVRAGEGLLFWISQTREKGRSVHMMQGRQPSKISTPDVDRILAADDLATVRALSIRVDGHQLYLLTLGTSNITLCYDLQSQAWTQWSSYTLGSPVSVSSITRTDTTATVTTSGAHGLSDGDPVKMAGANQSDYNGIFQAFVVSTTVFTIEVANSPTTPATGTITATPYTESYFKFTKYADANGTDVLLHETDGHLYQMLSTLYQDAGIPINRFCRTTRLDGGSDALKTMPAVRLIGDAGTAKVALRWSDDDCATFVTYRTLDMSLEKPETRRCGKFRRRTLALRDIGNTAERWEAAEIDIGGQ